MKLYSTICFGFLVVFFCETEKPPVISDFCKQTRVIKLSDADLERMTESAIRQVDHQNSRWKTHCQKRK